MQTIIGNFKIIEKLGEGGMGEVFKGVDTVLEREVAIKMLRPELSSRPEILERFRSEAVALARLNDPHIAMLYAFHQDRDQAYMVMEFVPGETLAGVMKRERKIPWRRALNLCCEVLNGLDHAHAKEIVHRDIKPANVMISPNGNAKLMDFGIARILERSRLTKTGWMVGTLKYMSPEQVQSLEVDRRSDLYSLGIVLYEILCGRVPFQKSTDYELIHAQIEEAPKPPTEWLPDLDPAIEKAVLRALAKNPAERFDSAADFRQALLAIRDSWERNVPWAGRTGARLGDFVIEGTLGRGGFKTVYAARNLAAARNGWPERVAVCVPHAQDEEARDLLANELRVVRTLDHPGIVQEYGLDEAEGILFAVMELVEGQPLTAVLSSRGPLPLDEAIEIVRQAGEALDYAHQGLAIHRDVKPANIHLGPGGSVKILDFGLARLMAHSQYKATSRVGSVAYMAPEQFEGVTGFNADLWGLGVTFYQLLTNTLPFPARDEGSLLRQILYEAPDLSPLDTEAFDRRLARVIAKVLEKDPEKRYQSAAGFLADLRAVEHHAATVNHVEGRIEVYLRAHFPLIVLQTFEEERALASLRRVREAMAVKKDIGLFVWSATRGLRDREDRLSAAQTIGDPVLALEQVFGGPAEAIYVFLDMHRHFTPVSVRLIRDAVSAVK
ncbi:MAG: protein kinase domain-containing protein, partial [Burkholderiales bacterium]